MTQLPELNFKTCSAEDIRKNLILNGCCLLRNAIEHKTLLEVKKTVEYISEKKSADVINGTNLDTHHRFHVEENEYREFSDGVHSFFDLLNHPKYKIVLDLVFGENRYQPNENTYTRGIDCRPNEQERDLTSFRPLDFHIDAVYHHPQDKFAVNFWIPFDDCGSDRPGLQVVPMDYRVVREIIDFVPTTAFSFSEATIDESRWSTQAVWKRIVSKMPKALAWRPKFKMGDIMLMNSWILHASYANSKMKKPRRSVEIRYMGDQLDPQPLDSSSKVVRNISVTGIMNMLRTASLSSIDQPRISKFKNILMPNFK